MQILSADQLRLADEYTIRAQCLTSWQLMERAAQAVFQQLKSDFGVSPKKYEIFCGPGNNGGDGLALARMLANQGQHVDAYLLDTVRYSPDNLQNQRLLNASVAHNTRLHIHRLSLDTAFEHVVDDEAVVIDALFGYGLTRSLGPEWASLIGKLSQHRGPVVSIDMPSGLLADRPSPPGSPIVKAKTTYTFHAPKLSLLQPDNAAYTGDRLIILDIGLSTEQIGIQSKSHHYTDATQVRMMIPHFNRFAHKGTFGHALLIGGSYGKMGSILLSSRAALRTGCGLVTSYVPSCGYEIMQTGFPEGMVWMDGGSEQLASLPASEKLSAFKAIGLGIGMGTAISTQAALRAFLVELSDRDHSLALVLDADGLNILSQNRDLLALLPVETILTPHPRELERLIGRWDNDWQKMEMAREFAHTHHAIVVIKGAHTAVVLPNGEIHFNSTGNPGMATAGSGDVLTGIITSLLAQGLEPKAAAICGVYVHGLAGDLAIQGIHPKSLIASDLVKHISRAWVSIQPAASCSF